MKKRGRKSDGDTSRTFGYRLRLNKNEWEQLQYLKSININIAKMFRESLRQKYYTVKNEKENI